MKQNSYIIIGILLFIAILISLFSVSDPVPYSKDTLFGIQYPYEGFDGDSATSSSMVSSSDTSPSNIISGMPDGSMPIMDNSTSENNEKKKVEGFSGLLSSPYGGETNLDVFSQLNSSKTCTPSPYSNSQGYLCLDNNTSKLLQTRGGNATGGNGQIV
jgi:hypothetical protein